MDNVFVRAPDETHDVFGSLEEILEKGGLGRRMAGLVPDGFFDKR